MTSTAEIVERLRNSPVWSAESAKLTREAADLIETLDAARRGEAAIAEEALKARDRAVEALREIAQFNAMSDVSQIARRALAEIDTESEGEG